MIVSMDDASEIITDKNMRLTANVLEQIVKSLQKPDWLGSDNGGEFNCGAFVQVLKKYGIRSSSNKTGRLNGLGNP
jgi:transposase InsO family protein